MTISEFLNVIRPGDMRFLHGFRLVRRANGRMVPNDPIAMASWRRGLKVKSNNESNIWFIMSQFGLNHGHLKSFINRWDQLIVDKGGGRISRVNLNHNELQGLVDEIELGV